MPYKKKRASGYHYETNKYGKKYRVYDKKKYGKKKYSGRSRRSTFSKVASGAGGLIGSALGGPLGGALGSTAGSLFSSIIGQGAYYKQPNPMGVQNNTLISPGDQIPTMHNDKGFIRVRHREFIADRTIETGFNSSNLAINPANSRLFPWLSQIAPNFEQWQMLGAVVEFKTTSGEYTNAQSPSLGTVSIATRYNVLSQPFSNRQQVLNHQYAVSTKPSESVMHPIECSPNQTPSQPLYVRLADQDPDLSYDARLYDLGTIQVVTSNGTVPSPGYVAGELWITYDILLMKPRLSSAATVLVIDAPEPGVPPAGPTEIHQPQLDVDEKNQAAIDQLFQDVADLKAQDDVFELEQKVQDDDIEEAELLISGLQLQNIAQDAGIQQNESDVSSLQVSQGVQNGLISQNLSAIANGQVAIVNLQTRDQELLANDTLQQGTLQEHAGLIPGATNPVPPLPNP